MIKWGILSTAKIAAEQIIPAILESKNSIIYGIASRDLKKAKKLVKQFDIKEAFSSYKDILNNKEINPCRLISDEQTFTDDLFNIIGDDPEMRKLFVHDLLDLEFTFDFCRDYYNFSSFTRGMSADYADKFPTFT